jgi:hypothetical protein
MDCWCCGGSGGYPSYRSGDYAGLEMLDGGWRGGEGRLDFEGVVGEVV